MEEWRRLIPSSNEESMLKYKNKMLELEASQVFVILQAFELLFLSLRIDSITAKVDQLEALFFFSPQILLKKTGRCRL